MYLPKTEGHISIENRFISLSDVKEALQSAFKLNVVEETARGLRGKIVRFARLYGFPVFWPSAEIEIWIDRSSQKLFYTFYWPDYYMLVFYVILLPVFLSEANMGAPDTLLLILVFLFNFFMINLDTRYVQSRVVKYLKKTQII